jgi:FtsH-binding integral membrane protein
MNRSRQTMSYQALAGLLLVFGALQGYGLSGIFMAYNLGSVYNIFLTTSVMFLLLALVGYNTNIDVSKV